MAKPDQQLPKAEQEKLKALKKKLDKFQEVVTDKLKHYVLGVAILPPPKDPQNPNKPPENPDDVHILVLVDDSDSMKMNKLELKDQLQAKADEMAGKIDKHFVPQVMILTELWQSCYDAKYDLLQLVAMGAPVYDKGMLAAVKIAEIHKNMVIKKFEKYIVSYVLAGSLTQGKATSTSDIDVWIVIDDTDVKKMTRAELKDKLRAIIIGMGLEAGDMTGIKNKLNIQVYILTEFWDSLKEANPVIFTLLRDGIPFYDRGMFMPWKQLLKMGKIKPSSEAIDMFMSSGDQMLKRAKLKIREIGMEDVFWAILTPSQAALMLYGIPPPTPRETPELMQEVFVKKEKLLEEKYVKTLSKAIQIRKELEHGTKKDITGKEVDDLLKESEAFLKRVNKLFSAIDEKKEKDSIVHIYDSVVTLIRDVLRAEGIERVSDIEIVNIFEDEMISQGKIPAKFLRILNSVIKAKKDHDENKLTKTGVEKVRKESAEFIKFIVEYMQRKRGRELERSKIRVKHGERYGEVLLLDTMAFIIHDIDHEEKEITKAPIMKNGGIGELSPSNLEELEHALASAQLPQKVFIKEKMFENLKNIFGNDVEVLINNF